MAVGRVEAAIDVVAPVATAQAAAVEDNLEIVHHRVELPEKIRDKVHARVSRTNRETQTVQGLSQLKTVTAHISPVLKTVIAMADR